MMGGSHVRLTDVLVIGRATRPVGGLGGPTHTQSSTHKHLAPPT